MLKNFTIQFKDLSNEISNRFDVNFIDFQKKILLKNYYSFGYLFEIKESNKKDISEIKDNFYYSEIGNVNKLGEVNPIKLNFNKKSEEYLDYFKKIEKGDIIKVEEKDILISKIRPNLKKYVFIDKENKNYFYTSAFIHLKPKKMNKILYYSLRNIFFNNLISISRQGKGYPTLKEYDLFYLKFDKEVIDKLEKNEKKIIKKIIPIENKIKELKNKIEKPQDIINKVFADEFSFNLNKFEELKKKKFFKVNFSDFSNNKDLRFGIKFHRKVNNFVLNEFGKITEKKIKDFISEPIVLGAGISPKNYDDNGKYHYISMANIKNWKFEKENSMLVSENYSNKNKNKVVSKNDILMSRSGEGTIGKIALIKDSQLKGIFADFIMRIKIKNYNFDFAYYYFNTHYFQYLIEINKKGLGNNTNIFPSQIREFPLINIPLSHQQKIVNKIKLQLDKQEEIKKEIEKERNKIDEIIENTILKNKIH